MRAATQLATPAARDAWLRAWALLHAPHSRPSVTHRPQCRLRWQRIVLRSACAWAAHSAPFLTRTTALFFTPELLAPLLHGVGLHVDQMRYDRRLAVNRATQERMYRVWLVAVLRKPAEIDTPLPRLSHDASHLQPVPQPARAWRPWLRVAVAAVVAAALMRRLQASPGLARLLKRAIAS